MDIDVEYRAFSSKVRGYMHAQVEWWFECFCVCVGGIWKCVCVEGTSTKHWPVEKERKLLCVTESIGSLFTGSGRQLAIRTN